MRSCPFDWLAIARSHAVELTLHPPLSLRPLALSPLNPPPSQDSDATPSGPCRHDPWPDPTFRGESSLHSSIHQSNLPRLNCLLIACSITTTTISFFFFSASSPPADWHTVSRSIAVRARCQQYRLFLGGEEVKNLSLPWSFPVDAFQSGFHLPSTRVRSSFSD